MARAPKAPAARGFTVAEKRSITFERISLYAVFLVAIIAAVISFQALWWMGQQMGLGWAAPLIPVAIDGFAIACSVGVVRSQASGEPLRERLSEWLGIGIALALSIAGNVTHAWHIGTGLIPWQLTVPVAAAIPVIVAYGIHVYGRAMVRGISAHVLAEDPDHLQFGLAHLGDPAHPTAAQAHAPVRVSGKAPARELTAQPAQGARTEDAQPARTDSAQPTRTTAPATRALKDPLKAAARDLFDAAIARDPLEKPDAAAIHRTIESPANVATTRRWVQSWWEEHQSEMGLRTDPIVEQVTDTEAPVVARSA